MEAPLREDPDPRMTAHPFDDADIRLIVTDMDGTLLDDEGRLPEGIWERLAELRSRGIVFAPASGRQYAALRRIFQPALEGMCVIAENGSLVMQDGVEVSSTTLDAEGVAAIVATTRGLVADGADVGIVVCGKRGAYVERTDPLFLHTSEEYYAHMTVVDDVLEHGDEVLKLAIVDFEGAGAVAEALSTHQATHQVVVSGTHWVDVMSRAVDKGVAVRALQQRLDIGSHQTAVFGDYLNDLQMLDAADHSFAMANAHPEVLARARHRAASNTEHGVLQAIDRLLARAA